MLCATALRTATAAVLPRAAVAAARLAAARLAVVAAKQQHQQQQARGVAAGASASADTIPNLVDKTFLVTGSTDGIGKHTAKRLAAAGANVLVHGRSRRRVEDALKEVEAAAAAGPHGTSHQKIKGYLADLSSLADVRRLAAAVAADLPGGAGGGAAAGGGGLHTLINNAGVYSDEFKRSADGFELTYAVNVLAPFLLTALLLPKVERHVITTSSISAASHLDAGNLQQERGYSSHGAYCASKCCNQVFTMRLARTLKGVGSAVVSSFPAAVGAVAAALGGGATWGVAAKRNRATNEQTPARTVPNTPLKTTTRSPTRSTPAPSTPRCC